MMRRPGACVRIKFDYNESIDYLVVYTCQQYTIVMYVWKIGI